MRVTDRRDGLSMGQGHDVGLVLAQLREGAVHWVVETKTGQSEFGHRGASLVRRKIQRVGYEGDDKRESDRRR